MITFKDYISESNLSRVWQHDKNLSTAYAIISPFRSENSSNENNVLLSKLKADVRKDGFGFVLLDGFWIENKGKPDERKVKEVSLFITAPENSSDNLKGSIRKWVKTYKQEAAVFRPANTKDGAAILIMNNHSELNLGKIKFSKAGDLYSQMRGKPNQTFVFERVLVQPQNYIHIMALKAKNQ